MVRHRIGWSSRSSAASRSGRSREPRSSSARPGIPALWSSHRPRSPSLGYWRRRSRRRSSTSRPACSPPPTTTWLAFTSSTMEVSSLRWMIDPRHGWNSRPCRH